MTDKDKASLQSAEEEIAVKEAAIVAWENDQTRNPDSLRVVRGADGKPVEIIVKDEEHATFVVNGEERLPFELIRLVDNKKPTDPIPNLCLDGVLQEGYLIKAVKHIPFGASGYIDTLIGKPMGTPPGLIETNHSSISLL